jgi:hypothetical protein
MTAVRSVSVISTGWVRIHPEHAYGSKKPLYWWLLTSRRWTPPRPVNVYVIEHARGLVLFDTGQDRASVTDKGHFPGPSSASLRFHRHGHLRVTPGPAVPRSAQITDPHICPSRPYPRQHRVPLPDRSEELWQPRSHHEQQAS